MSFTITDTLANCFGTGEVSLTVYAFTPDTFGGVAPSQFTIPPTSEAVASATADSSGNFTLTVPAVNVYHLAAHSVLNNTTYYWTYNHAVDAQTRGQDFLAGGATPTIAVQSGAGTSPPTPTLASGSNDSRGVATWGTGTSTGTGAQVQVTFGKAYARAPQVMLTPANDATEALGVELGTVATTSFIISLHSAPSASQGASTYSVEYEVIG